MSQTTGWVTLPVSLTFTFSLSLCLLRSIVQFKFSLVAESVVLSQKNESMEGKG